MCLHDLRYAWGIKHASAGVGYAALSGVSSGNAQRGVHALEPLDSGNVGRESRGQGCVVVAKRKRLADLSQNVGVRVSSEALC